MILRKQEYNITLKLREWNPNSLGFAVSTVQPRMDGSLGPCESDPK